MKKIILGFYIDDDENTDLNLLAEKARISIREELNLHDSDVSIMQIIGVEKSKTF